MSSRRRRLAGALCFALVASATTLIAGAAGSAAVAAPTPDCSMDDDGLDVCTVVFNAAASDETQTFTVPAGVTSVRVSVRGAAASSKEAADVEAGGGVVKGSFATTPGSVLNISVGAVGPPNKGGGGSYVFGPADLVVVAGGAGGSGNSGQGGSGGGVGPSAQATAGVSSPGGEGATDTAAGRGGAGQFFGQAGSGPASLSNGKIIPGDGGLGRADQGHGGGGWYGGGGGGFTMTSGDSVEIGGGGGGSGHVSSDVVVTESYAGTNLGSGSVTLTYKVKPPLAVGTTSLPGATYDASYSATLSASGGTAPYTWGLSSGSLPAGLTLSSGGTISGTPTAATTTAASFTVRVTDTSGATATKPVTLAVAKADQTVTFTSPTSPMSPKVGGTYVPTATGGGSGNPVRFQIATGTSSVCSISAGTVTFNAVGQCAINAIQDGNASYHPGSAGQTVTVGKGSQTVSFTSQPPTDPEVGQTYIPAVTRGSSSNAIVIGVSTASASVCSEANGFISFNHPGTCVVTADQAGDSDYEAAPQATQSITVGKGAQVVSFTSTAPANPTVGQSYTPTATGRPSGDQVVLGVSSGSAGVCTMTDGSVSFSHAGTCVVSADQAGNDDYDAGQATQSITVGKASQTVTITSTPTSPRVNGIYSPQASRGGSGNFVSFGVTPASANVCSYDRGRVFFGRAGTCVVTADQSGNDAYAAAPQATQSITVGKADQAISITSDAPTAAVVGESSYDVTVDDSETGSAVTVQVDPSTTNGACTVSGSGSTVSFAHPGTCAITATRVAGPDYNAATSAVQSFAVGKGTQTVSVTSTAPSAAVVGGSSYDVTSSSSPGARSVVIDPSTTNGACTVAGSTVSFVHAGTCAVRVDAAATDDYRAASSAMQSFAVGKGTQTVSVTSTAPSAAVVGGSSYDVTSSSSPGARSVVVDASTTNGACAVSGSTVSFVHAGTCAVRVDAAATDDNRAASSAVQSFAVGKGLQAPAITSAAPGRARVAGTSYTVTGSSTPGAQSVVVDPATTNEACTVSGSSVSFVHPGTCAVRVDAVATDDYRAASSAVQSFAVGKGSQVPGVAPELPENARVGDQVELTATGGGSGNRVVFAISGATSNRGVGPTCSLTPTAAGVRVSYTAVGKCSVVTSQQGSADYDAAQDQVLTTDVSGRVSSTALEFSTTTPVAGEPVRLTATVTGAGSGAQGTVQLTVDGTPSGAPQALDSTGTASFSVVLGAGAHPVSAAFTGDPTTTVNSSTTRSLVVGAAATTTSVAVSPDAVTATVRPVAPGSGVPTGSVELRIGGAAVGTATLRDGVARFARSIPVGQAAEVSAVYAGDASYLTSTGTTQRRDPTITAAVSSAAPVSEFGWYGSPVTVTFTCAAGSAALAGACPAPVQIGENSTDRSVTARIATLDGGAASVTVGPFAVDETAPKLRIVQRRGKAPRCAASDALSGVASHQISRRRTDHGMVLVAKAVDGAGNETVRRARLRTRAGGR